MFKVDQGGVRRGCALEYSDVAGMAVADLLAAGMPKADAKVVFKHLNGRAVEDGDSVIASGVTTPGGSNASETVSEIAVSMSQGMANAARSAMEKVAARSKVAPLKELSGIQPSVIDIRSDQIGSDQRKSNQIRSD